MTALPQHRLTEAEYLAQERLASFKSEYLDGETFAMAGASLPHNRISVNTLALLRPQLEGRGCDVFTSDLRIRVSQTGLYTYPDLVVVCGEPELLDEQNDTLLNPKLIIEILSRSTEAYDRGQKFGHYRTIASLTDYVLISQERPLIEHFSRSRGIWELRTAEGLEATLELPSIGCRLALAEVYRRVKLLGERQAT